jgi:hypothetical protein
MDPSNPTGQGGNGAGPGGPAAADVPPMTLPLPPNPAQPGQDGAAAGGQPGQMPQIGQAPPTSPAQPGAQMSAPAPQIDVDGTTQAVNAPVLDDGDLIEKEWVNKAKQIVEKNRNDPHKQSEQLTAFRADYMKKHFNKDIKQDK